MSTEALIWVLARIHTLYSPSRCLCHSTLAETKAKTTNPTIRRLTSQHEDCRTASCSDANEDAAEDLVRVLGAGGAGDRPPSGVGASGQLRLFNHPSAAAAIAAIAGLQAGGSSSWRNIRGRHPKQPVRDAPQQGGRGGCARRGDASVARHSRP